MDHVFKDGRYVARLVCPPAGKIWGYCTTDAERLKARIEKFEHDYSKAGKFRRRAVVGGVTREFPPSWNPLSTREYVKVYFRLNKSVFHSHGCDKEDQAADLAFFEPLSDKVCIVPPGYHDTPTAEAWDGIE